MTKHYFFYPEFYFLIFSFFTGGGIVVYFYSSRNSNISLVSQNIIIYIIANIAFMTWIFFTSLRKYEIWRCILGALTTAIFGTIFFIMYMKGDLKSAYTTFVISLIGIYLVKLFIFKTHRKN